MEFFDLDDEALEDLLYAFDLPSRVSTDVESPFLSDRSRNESLIQCAGGTGCGAVNGGQYIRVEK